MLSAIRTWGPLEAGVERVICEARAEYSEGVLKACDPYGCSEIQVPPPIVPLPLPPIVRPFSITSVVYVQFERRVYVEKGMTLWATIPLDVELVHKGRTLAVLASTRAKYRLVGSLVEGVIARNHVSKVHIGSEPPEWEVRPCEAIVAFRVVRGMDVIEGVPFNASNSTIFRDGKGRLYLSMVNVAVGPAIIDSRTTGERPAPGLRVARKPPYESAKHTLALGQTAVVVERGWRLWPTLRE